MDSVLTITLQLSVIYSLAGVLWILRLASLDSKNLIILTCIYFICSIPTLSGSYINNHVEVFQHLKWNWAGKIITIVTCTITVFLLGKHLSGFRFADAGFTFRQNKGSFFPVVIVCGGIILWLIATNDYSLADKRLETVLFQALTSGLSEEPVYRGLVLYFLTMGIKSRSINIIRAPINWACFLSSLLFGFAHGFFVENQTIAFDLGITLGTMITGIIFLWLRQITGSLVLPIAMHNFLNLNVALTNPKM